MLLLHLPKRLKKINLKEKVYKQNRHGKHFQGPYREEDSKWCWPSNKITRLESTTLVVVQKEKEFQMVDEEIDMHIPYWQYWKYHSVKDPQTVISFLRGIPILANRVAPERTKFNKLVNDMSYHIAQVFFFSFSYFYFFFLICLFVLLGSAFFFQLSIFYPSCLLHGPLQRVKVFFKEGFKKGSNKGGHLVAKAK